MKYREAFQVTTKSSTGYYNSKNPLAAITPPLKLTDDMISFNLTPEMSLVSYQITQWFRLTLGNAEINSFPSPLISY